jgi:hypothetical protein
MIALFDSYFHLRVSSDIQQAVEVQSLAELRSQLKYQVQTEFDAFNLQEPCDSSKFKDLNQAKIDQCDSITNQLKIACIK